MIQLSLNVGEETSFDGSGTQTVILNDNQFSLRTYTGQDSFSWVVDSNIGLVNAAIIYKDGAPVMSFAASPNIWTGDGNIHTLTIYLLERHHQTLSTL